MTNSISIAANVRKLRNKKGLTQERLARSIGVTSAAVSKWECGQALPDIAILGPLAMMLETTTDELLGYRPDLTEENAAALLEEATALFEGNKGFRAEEACEKLLRTYPASLELAFHVASLYCLHAPLEPNEEARSRRVERGVELFERCRIEGRPEMRDASLYVLAGLYLSTGETEKALSAIEEYHQPESDIRVMEVAALAHKGELEAAEELARERLAELERDEALYREALESVVASRAETLHGTTKLG